MVGFEPTIFWATTRRVNPYTTSAIKTRENATISPGPEQINSGVTTGRGRLGQMGAIDGDVPAAGVLASF